MTPPPSSTPGVGESLREEWPALDPDARAAAFQRLPASEAEEFFLGLSALGQAQILLRLPERERRLWLRLLAPDDVADVLQEVEPADREGLLQLLDTVTRAEVRALLAYAEDDAGGLMSPRFARVRPDMSVEEAIRYLQRQARDRLETIYYAYVLDAGQRLLGVCSFRELFAASPSSPVREVMEDDPVTIDEDTDQEAVARLFLRYGFLALPVVDAEGRMKGIVTIDDIVDVLQEEATEDVQKYGGMQALDAPYLQTGFGSMIRKRAGWLTLLFLGETLTASAMGYFEDALARAVVLAVFLPLIVSSGGNSGSQASTLIVRAMALGEVKLRDVWLIARREFLAGATLGVILAAVGALRVVLWQAVFGSYGEHAARIALTVGLSVVGVVTLGTLTGSMLPFLIRRCGWDPASASAPFVATVVDVGGVVIYFGVAQLILGGSLL
ncbi:MAG: magnesium transporter [Planctomycetota bacterium]|nr:MAG: magnesium transporter [Planctomycetota bacterium]